MRSSFEVGEDRWRARLGTLRQVVRQELVTRQLARHVPADRPVRVVDLGCGQGTQALHLARAGHQVTGVDTSAALLADLGRTLDAEPPDVRAQVRTVEADVLANGLPAGGFDVVLCHGVLMYFADPAPVLAELARLVAPGGVVSVLARNGDALAMRPGLLGDWTTTRRAFDDLAYDNRIGVPARADRRDDLVAALEAHGLDPLTWYGVRVFTDTVPAEQPPPAELAELLAAEERAGATDPYRAVAALTHVLVARPA